MSYWKGEEITVFYSDGAHETVTVVQCDRGHRGWRLLCQAHDASEPDRVVWDSEGGERPERDPVAGVRRTGIFHPLV